MDFDKLTPGGKKGAREMLALLTRIHEEVAKAMSALEKADAELKAMRSVMEPARKPAGSRGGS
jgi:hypothetical protein